MGLDRATSLQENGLWGSQKPHSRDSGRRNVACDPGTSSIMKRVQILCWICSSLKMVDNEF